VRETSFSPGWRRLAGVALVLLVITALVLVVVPIWLIRPFVHQTPEGLSVAMALRRQAPLATLAVVAAALFLSARLWRNARWWSRALIVLSFTPLLGATWLARQNIYESKMFAPLAETRSVPAAQASWVENGDSVLAVTLHGDAAAYPVRQVAYHHIVHDVVGGVPVAVTY
jgi:thiol:disulfide interchange protein